MKALRTMTLTLAVAAAMACAPATADVVSPQDSAEYAHPISTGLTSEVDPVEDPDPTDGVPDGEYGYQEDRLYDPAEEPQSEEQAVDDQVQTFEEESPYTGTGIDGYGHCDDYGVAIEGGCREPQPGESGYDERQQMLSDQEGATNDQYTAPDGADGAGEPVPSEAAESGEHAATPVATDAATAGDAGATEEPGNVPAEISSTTGESAGDGDTKPGLARTGAAGLRAAALLAAGSLATGTAALLFKRRK